jgi:hypothetical protein
MPPLDSEYAVSRSEHQDGGGCERGDLPNRHKLLYYKSDAVRVYCHHRRRRALRFRTSVIDSSAAQTPTKAVKPSKASVPPKLSMATPSHTPKTSPTKACRRVTW